MRENKKEWTVLSAGLTQQGKCQKGLKACKADQSVDREREREMHTKRERDRMSKKENENEKEKEEGGEGRGAKRNPWAFR